MKALLTAARNIRHCVVGDKIETEIEAVLTTVEKHTEFVGASVTQVERCETIRFTISPDTARSFAQWLLDWAEQAEDIEEWLQLKKAGD